MSDANKKPIVVKRIKKMAHGAHGGAWKIAYADFVTAMMAFFLLMWLLGSTTSGDLKGIAEYFKTPLKVALAGGSGSGDASSLIKAGGQDLTRQSGQVKAGTDSDESKKQLRTDPAELLRAQKEKEMASLTELKFGIEQLFDTNVGLKNFKSQIKLDLTSEGLRIQIVDERNRPMFQSGSAILAPYAAQILQEIGKMLNDVPNKISLSGHTDALPYSGGSLGYSNWELSSDRANASRRELIAGGLEEEKVVRVVGLASAVLFNKNDPFDPTNRRISVMVMNKVAEDAAQNDGGVINVEAVK